MSDTPNTPPTPEEIEAELDAPLKGRDLVAFSDIVQSAMQGLAMQTERGLFLLNASQQVCFAYIQDLKPELTEEEINAQITKALRAGQAEREMEALRRKEGAMAEAAAKTISNDSAGEATLSF